MMVLLMTMLMPMLMLMRFRRHAARSSGAHECWQPRSRAPLPDQVASYFPAPKEGGRREGGEKRMEKYIPEIPLFSLTKKLPQPSITSYLGVIFSPQLTSAGYYGGRGGVKKRVGMYEVCARAGGHRQDRSVGGRTLSSQGKDNGREAGRWIEFASGDALQCVWRGLFGYIAWETLLVRGDAMPGGGLVPIRI